MTTMQAQVKDTQPNLADTVLPETAAVTCDPLDEIYREINNIVIVHPRMTRALNKVHECRILSKGAREPECLLILGRSGVGKTTIKDHYLSLHPRTETAEGTTIPALAATIPVPANMITMATALLASLGDPLAHTGTLVSRTHRLYKLVRDCNVELIILDEFQHFIDRDNDKILRSVSDWLKNLISETKVPIVLTGLPDSRKVLEANDQLCRRFSCQINLSPFSWVEHHRPSYQRFLGALEKSLPFKTCNFSDEKMAQRFFFATHGYIAPLMKIVRGAAFAAAKAKAEKIDLGMLEKAFAERVLQPEDLNRKKVDRANPFMKNWKAPETPIYSTKRQPEKMPSQKASKKPSVAAARRAVSDVFTAGASA